MNSTFTSCEYARLGALPSLQEASGVYAWDSLCVTPYPSSVSHLPHLPILAIAHFSFLIRPAEKCQFNPIYYLSSPQKFQRTIAELHSKKSQKQR